MTLDEFLDALVDCPLFVVKSTGKIRSTAYSEKDSLYNPSCPICSVVFHLTGERFNNADYNKAAKVISLSANDAQRIISASDWRKIIVFAISFWTG